MSESSAIKRVLCITGDSDIQKRLELILKSAGADVDFSDQVPSRIDTDDVRLIIYDLAEGGSFDAAKGFLEKVENNGVPVFLLTHNLNQEQKISLLDFSNANNLQVRDWVIDESEFAADVSKILSGNVFGLEKYLPYGVAIKQISVSNYQQKSDAIDKVKAYANKMKVRKRIRNAIEKVLDELLMNAIYDAPVDKDGQPLFANLPSALRVKVQLDARKAVCVQYGCSGKYFAIGVLDQYGSLEKSTVLQYWRKCISQEDQIDQKPGGAGLGLYLVLSSVTSISINLEPKSATEVICLFDLKSLNEDLPRSFQVHYGAERKTLDNADLRVPKGRQRSPGILYLLTTLLVLIVAAAVLFVTQFSKQREKPQEEVRRERLVMTSLSVTSQPAGAQVYINGKPYRRIVGSNSEIAVTPLKISSLRPGQDVSVTLKRKGYIDVTKVVELKAGQPASVKLALVRKVVRIVIRSTQPKNVEVRVNGKLRGRTPLTLNDVPLGRKLQIALSKPGYATASRLVDTGKGNFTWEASLGVHPDYSHAFFSSTPGGAEVTIDAGKIDQRTPVSRRLIKTGRRYRITMEKKGFALWSREVVAVKGKALIVSATLQPVGGVTIQSNVEVWVFLNNKAMGKAPVMQPSLSAGRYHVRIINKKLHISHWDKNAVIIKGGEEITRSYSFGRVQIKAPPTARLYLKKRPRDLYRNRDVIYLLPGRYTIHIKRSDQPAEKSVVVRVQADQVTRVNLR